MSVLRLFQHIVKFDKNSLLSICNNQFKCVNNIKHLSTTVTDTRKVENLEENIETEKSKKVKKVPVETSIKYLASEAYKSTYGDQLVWEQYRRNHKGAFPTRRTRKTCIRKEEISTGNPCPICRDEYLVLDHRNLDLLKQFISPQSGEVLSFSKTGICQKKHQELLIAVERAMDYGLLTFDVPIRKYDYSEYYPSKEEKSN